MRFTLVLSLGFVGMVLAGSGSQALGNDNHFSGQQLAQVSFNRLIPTSYPTIKPSFGELQPTTSPLIYPEIPQVHITEDLTQSFSRPLLITSE
jgi:hypothetical protein